MTTQVEKYDNGTVAVATMDALTPQAVLEQVALIQHVMKDTMKKDEHYGVIPGTGNKPTLLKPGAEKLSLTFRLAPRYEITRHDLQGGHREYEVVCLLYHISTNAFVGSGVGLCTTMEKKYRYRGTAYEVTCDAIPNDYRDRKAHYKAQGFGAKKEGAQWVWVKYGNERAENEDLADTYNTVLKMAKKRAHVDAILTATAASDIFTQDVEDMDFGAQAPQNGADSAPQSQQAPPPPEMITPDQMSEVEAILTGRAWTDGERDAFRAKAERWTKAQAEGGITRLSAEHDRRIEEEADIPF